MPATSTEPAPRIEFVEFVEFDHGTPWYDRVLRLRNAVLREPLGLRFTEEDLAAERGQRHFALVAGAEPLACLIAKPLDDGRSQLRQMAVAPMRQGEGLGRRLIEHVEAALLEQGVERVMLHARAESVGFYEKLGYTPVGEAFLEVSIPHREMVKRLG